MLTREISSLHVVLWRLDFEYKRSDNPINRPDNPCREEFRTFVDGCEKAIDPLDRIAEKFSSLSDRERGGKKVWQRVRFGNGKMAGLGDLRTKIVFYMSAISLLINIVSMNTIGSVEKQMDEAGGDLRELKIELNGVAAHLMSGNSLEGSVLTTYSEDDKAVWKAFPRELIKDGIRSSVTERYNEIIKAYVKELGSRGLLESSRGSSVNQDETLSKRLNDFPSSVGRTSYTIHLPYRGQPQRELSMQTVSEVPSTAASEEFLNLEGTLPPNIDWVAASESISSALDNIWHLHHEQAAPQCIDLILHPPRTKKAWDERYQSLKMRIEQQVLRNLDEIDMRTEEYANFRYQIANDAQDMLNVLACYKQDHDWRWKDTWHRKKNGASVLVELNNGDQIIESRPGPLCPHFYPLCG
ncbi:hypothetical protein ABVK25_011725 [Lepraria finkii]|uniref:Fungal N-terminal domain-containing protein n=1 Tax=Lepraria finkii TaxID=1340010 RepID=A0ABR4AM83_9LECA